MPINRNILKSYAPAARLEFIQAVTDRASVLGLSAKKIEPVEVKGDVAIIAGRPFPKDVADRRQKLEARIKLKGFSQVMEEVAYTWFNRFTALRYMELHDYLGHGYRVLSNPSGSDIPEILEKATSVDLPGLDKDKVAELRLAGDKDAELYNMLLVKQCNALHRVMPKLFESVNGPSELLLPENLLQTNSPIRKLVNDIPEENWGEIEIVGWLYQFYIIERRKEVFGSVVESKDIPAATQLFTPNWIVKYMVQNTLGRKWLMTYPASAIKGKMEFYIEPAEQEPEVQAKLDAISPKELNPEELTFMDPACGSGHILAEAYDLFKEIYLERGYRTRDIPRLILEKNLYGLDIDDRAAQLARFTALMKARGDDRRILDPEKPVQLNIMAIQESKGLDVDEVARVLLREQVKEISGRGEQQLSLVQPKMSQASLSTSEKPDVTKAELYSLLHLFEDGKTFGSLLTVHDKLKEALPRLEGLVAKALQASDMESRRWAEALLPLVNQAKLLAVQYDYVVANPPYMGSKGLNSKLKAYAKDEYPDSKSDLFSMFIEQCLCMTKHNSFSSLITMQSWMFLSSFEKLRSNIFSNKTISSMLHLGPGMFDHYEKKVSQHTAFVLFNSSIKNYIGPYYRLVEGHDEFEKMNMLQRKKVVPYYVSSSYLEMLPGAPISYWVPKEIRDVFVKGKPLKTMGDTRQGMATSDNNRFLRAWSEVDFHKLGFNATDRNKALNLSKKWFPYNKGGDYRKWYGNSEFVINWEEDGKEVVGYAASLYGSPTRTIKSMTEYFKPCASWSKISNTNLAMRYYPPGYIFDVAGCAIFTESEDDLLFLMGYSNSLMARSFIESISPTLNFEAGQIALLPIIDIEKGDFIELAKELISLAKLDWDSFEKSWDFERIDLLNAKTDENSLVSSYAKCKLDWARVTKQMKLLEDKNSFELAKAFGLRSAHEYKLDDKDVTLLCNPSFRYGNKKTNDGYESLLKADTIRELISYAIGCAMGRYSLDEPGLIYAHSCNEGFDPSRYATFPADEDGIVPVMDDDWFEDDATNRFVEFLKVAWSPETLEENLKFVADSLEPKRGESPLDTIRRFISQKFFKDHHLKVYKKRPIYWLFSSGKQRAFECLVYLHRYNENTLARMRAMYVTPLQGKYNARIEYLEKELPAASSTSAAKKLQKELDTMRKKQQELREFDELLRHYADQRISLDLDDGVKVNYGKFGNLLANVKEVTGKKPQ